MKTKVLSLYFACAAGVIGFFVEPIESACGQSIQLTNAQVKNLQVQFQVQASTNAYYRVDSSPDLMNWLPVDYYFATNTAHTTTNSYTKTNQAQFYRALQVNPGVAIIDFTPGAAMVNSQIEIFGQFLPPLGQYTVQINGVNAPITSGDSARLFVTVPPGAGSGLITISNSAGGTIVAGESLAVLSNAVVRFQPPVGIATNGFTIENNYGAGVFIANTAGEYSIPVRQGFPTLSFAAVPGHESNLFLCAMSFGAGQVIDMNASSTASALVFQDWVLTTADPAVAPAIMALIQTNSAVLAFGQVLSNAMLQSASPYQQAVVTNAYQAAILSVLTNESFGAVTAQIVAEFNARAAASRTGAPDDENPAAGQIYDVFNPPLPISVLTTALGLKGTTGRYLKLTAEGYNFTMDSPNYLYNPEDWVVAFESVDVDASFPDGRPAFDQVWQNVDITPQAYVTNGVFHQQRSVAANPFSSRINVTDYLVGKFAALFVPEADTSVAIPPGDGMYVVRGVGPALLTAQDFNFVTTKMPNEYQQAAAVNLANTAFVMLSLFSDEKTADLVEKLNLIKNVALQLVQEGPIQNQDQFIHDVQTILLFLVEEGLTAAVKGAVSAVVSFVEEADVPGLAVAQALQKVAATASTVGVLAERAVGLVNSTALETSFIVVGDPFAFKNVTITPNPAAPSETVTLTFKGSPNLRSFDPNNSADFVTFRGASYFFNGEVQSVSGPDANGVQTLKVTIPASLGGTVHDGPYTMTVATQGRTGTMPFTLSTTAAISSVTPIQGFAPSANFNGSPYAGTPVRLQGALFTWTDKFLFAGGSNGVPATQVEPNGINPGDVTIYVPSGAVTGPLQILHNTSAGILRLPGPVFTVLGPPVITSAVPASGAAAGTIVTLTVNQVGSDPSLVLAQFGGGYAGTVYLQSSNVVVPIPVNAQSGSLSILTPAGTNTIPYELTAFVPPTNLVQGAIIYVGSTPFGQATGISLAQAVSFANGTAFPSYAQASNGISTWYPTATNLELGPGYINIITGTASDDATISCNYDHFSCVLSGNIVVSGNNNLIGGTLSGSVSVTGGGNSIGGSISGPMMISGTNNAISGTVTASMTVTGEGNEFNYATFQGVAGDALTILGNANSGTLNFVSNSGDGLVIDGGSYNELTVNQSIGNTGNGVTVTGGAAVNTLRIFTGSYSNQAFGVAGTGNQGHGIALIDSAIGNDIQGLSSGLGGNAVDGIYMDGPEVMLNSYIGNVTFNGRNGVTITNGASGNSIGYIDTSASYLSSPAIVDYNVGSGVVCADCGENNVNVLVQQNGLYGVLLSGVNASPGGFLAIVQSQSTGGAGNPLYISGNGEAGLRLENGTTGVQVLGATLSDGLELDGATVGTNVIFATIYGAPGDGAFIGNGANSNDLTLGVSGSVGDGVLLQGASNNLVQVFASTDNDLNGIHVTQGSAGNHIVAPLAPSYYGDNVGDGVVTNTLDGCLVDSGSSNNIIDSISFSHNARDGLAFSGTNVTGNSYLPASNPFLSSSVGKNGRDGIRFEQGASENIIGTDPSLDTNAIFGVQIAGGDGEAGILITDPETGSNLVQGCSIYGELVGVLAQNGAAIGQITQSTIQDNYNGIVLQSGAHDGVLNALMFQFDTNDAVLISDGYNIVIGGDDSSSLNQFNNNPTGIEITGELATNVIVNNNVITTTILVSGVNAVFIHDGPSQNALFGTNLLAGYPCGVRIQAASSNVVSQTTIQNNQNTGTGIIISSAANNNVVEGNVIRFNNIGVLVSDEGTVGNSILGNSITANQAKGIQLSAGGNTQIPPPMLLPYSGLIVDGTAKAPDGSIVEIFWDTGDEGKTYVGGGPVSGGAFSVTLDTDPAQLGPVQLNATVTDPDGNTSEFSGPQTTHLPNLAFTATNSSHRQIYFSADGNKPINLTGAWNPGSDDFGPAMPAGVACGKLLFVSLRTGNQEVFVMEPTSNSVPQQVTTNQAGDYDPAWLVPCERVVFVSNRDGNPQIYAVNLDGTDLQRLTTNSFANVSPSASADGTKIVFVSNRSGTNVLWIMNADGSDQSPIGGVTGIPSAPAFGPDGMTIALAVTRPNGASEIATVVFNGTQFTQVTSNGAHATHPTWLPDGQNLVFSSDLGGPVMLYQVASSGGMSQALTINPNVGTEPSAGGD